MQSNIKTLLNLENRGIWLLTSRRSSIGPYSAKAKDFLVPFNRLGSEIGKQGGALKFANVQTLSQSGTEMAT